VWAYPEEHGWQSRVDLSRISTAIEDTVSVAPGPVDTAILATLERQDFDHAPVRNQHADHGIVPTTYLRQLAREGRQLERGDPAILHAQLEVVSPLHDVFEMLGKNHAALVVYDTSDRDGYPYDYVGLITVSDLNRHAFRAVIYQRLADLEAALARLVEHAIADPWNWIRLLREERQAAILGNWELAKRKDVDVGPIAGTMLTDLLAAVRDSAELRTMLNTSRNELDGRSKGIGGLRNRGMHPVRPLLLGHSELEDLRGLLDHVLSLTDLVVSGLSRPSQGGTPTT
jgi:hypothetical protein